jgi:hypothetical protein
MSQDASPPKGNVQKTKFIPSIKVWANDLVVEDDEGNKYHPHYGEWVRFRKSVPIAAAEVLASIEDAQRLDPEEHRDEIVGIGGRLIDLILDQILDWNLTSDEAVEPDEDGKYPLLPHPRKERAAARKELLRCENFLLLWLQEHMMDGAQNPPGSNSPPIGS